MVSCSGGGCLPRAQDLRPGDSRYVLGYVAGDGPAEQRRSIEAWCDTYDRFLVDVVEDSGGSHLVERRALVDALLRVEDEGLGVLLVGSRAALPPSSMEIGVLVDAVRRAGAGLRVVGVPDPLGGDREAVEMALEAHRWLIYAPHARRGLRRQRERGVRRGGVVPYGYSRDTQGRLHPEPAEQEAIRLARELHEQGMSAARIGQRLTELGHRPRGKKWHPTTVTYLLRERDT